MLHRLVLCPVLFVLAAGCATPAQKVDFETKTFRAEPKGDDGFEVYDAEDLLARADDLFDGELYEEAAGYYERLIREFPDAGAEVARAHFSAAEAYLRIEDGPRALHHADAFLGMADTAAERTRRRARFKRGAALAYMKRYDDAAEVFDIILVDEGLTVAEHIEALVDSGVAHFMREDRPTAEHRFLKARRLYKRASTLERIPVKYFIAQASFYLAELARLDFEDFSLQVPTAEQLAESGQPSMEHFLGQQLEQKCQLLLRAQYQFLRVIREAHVGWASAAGYKVGTMYEVLYDDLTALPVPDDLDGEAGALYRTLLRDKVMILLEKAIRVWQSTADMAVRTGADNLWVERTRESLARVRAFVAQHSAERTTPAT